MIDIPSGYVKIAIEHMAIEIVDLPHEKFSDFPISYVNVYQRVYIIYIYTWPVKWDLSGSYVG